MYVIVKKFEVSNSARCPFKDDLDEEWYKESLSRIIAPSDIENEINKAVSQRNIVSVTVTPVENQQHNNGRGNTVELWYTIVLS